MLSEFRHDYVGRNGGLLGLWRFGPSHMIDGSIAVRLAEEWEHRSAELKVLMEQCLTEQTPARYFLREGVEWYFVSYAAFLALALGLAA